MQYRQLKLRHIYVLSENRNSQPLNRRCFFLPPTDARCTKKNSNQFKVVIFRNDFLIQIVLPDDKNYDVRQQYVSMTNGELKGKYRTLQLEEFPGPSDSSVLQMEMAGSIIKKFENWIRRTPKRALAHWLTWRWTADRVDQLGTCGSFRLRKLKKSVHGFFGTETKWRKCVQQVRSEAPFLLDVLYYGST